MDLEVVRVHLPDEVHRPQTWQLLHKANNVFDLSLQAEGNRLRG